MLSPTPVIGDLCTECQVLVPLDSRVDDNRGMNTSPLHLVAGDHDDRGAATAEYAIATVAAAGFAGLLAVVLKSNPVQNLLTNLISGALSIVS